MGTYEVKVEVFELEFLQGVLEGSLDVLGLVGVVPELGSDEHLLTLDTSSLDSLTNFVLRQIGTNSSLVSAVFPMAKGNVDSLGFGKP